jgi:hypothetical protein
VATGSQALLTARAALGATEGASTTPTRLMYLGTAENIDTTGLQQFETIEDRLAWAKADGLRNIYAGIENNTFSVSNVPLSFEDTGFLLCTVPGMVSGAGAGAGTPTTTDTSAYTRAFVPSQTVTTYGATGGYDMHLQIGTTDFISTVGWSIPGLKLTDFTMTFNKRATGTDTGCLFSGTWQTPKACTDITAFTGSLSDRTQTHPIGNTNKTYLDTSTSGTTADPEITTAVFHWARQPSFHDGMDDTGLHTSMHFPGHVTTDLTITRKFSDKTELNAYVAKTLRKFRLLNEGALIGATTALNTVRVDFIGKITGHQPTWVDGMLYATITYSGMYDSTLLSSWSAQTISTTSAAYTTA